MAEQELSILLKLKDDASAQLKKISSELATNEKAWKSNYGAIISLAKQASIAFLAAGGLITAGLIASARAAQEEKESQQLLAATLNNVGVAYSEVRGEIENSIRAISRKTGVADEAQRQALSNLILATRSYEESLRLLPLALDLAAAKHMDLASAATIVGRVANGTMEQLGRYGIILNENATASEKLAQMQDQLAGSAAAAADPFEILSVAMGDLKESIGTTILPMITEFINKLVVVVDKVNEWVAANPVLVEGILKFGGALLALGATIAVILSIAKAIQMINMALALMLALSGPAGWAILAVAGAIALTGLALSMKGNIIDLMGTEASREWPPSFAGGGVIPGPVGQPVPIIAHGGERFLGSGGGGGTNINVYVQGDVISDNQLIEKVRQGLLYLQFRNGQTTGIA